MGKIEPTHPYGFAFIGCNARGEHGYVPFDRQYRPWGRPEVPAPSYYNFLPHADLAWWFATSIREPGQHVWTYDDLNACSDAYDLIESLCLSIGTSDEDRVWLKIKWEGVEPAKRLL